MKQVKQIIEFILVLASCFFRSKKQQTGNNQIPSNPYPPDPPNGRKRDCRCGPGCTCYPDPAQPPESPGTHGNQPAPAVGTVASERPNSTTLLGWCLIAVASTSYLYKLLV